MKHYGAGACACGSHRRVKVTGVEEAEKLGEIWSSDFCPAGLYWHQILNMHKFSAVITIVNARAIAKDKTPLHRSEIFFMGRLVRVAANGVVSYRNLGHLWLAPTA